MLIIAPLSHMNDLIVQVRSTVGSAAWRGAGRFGRTVITLSSRAIVQTTTEYTNAPEPLPQRKRVDLKRIENQDCA